MVYSLKSEEMLIYSISMKPHYYSLRQLLYMKSHTDLSYKSSKFMN